MKRKQRTPFREDAHRGSVLLLTLMMIVLMTFEVALVSLVVLHGLGEEGVLSGQHIAAKRASEAAMSSLFSQLTTEIKNKDIATIYTEYALGGTGQASYNNQLMTVTDPATGTSGASVPPIYISAWIDTATSRGNSLHLVGRARVGTVDLLTHRWQWLESGCFGPGTLTTILSSEKYPGLDSVKVGTDGRLFIGQDTGTNGKFWTWHPGTGLSVLKSSIANFSGARAMGLSTLDNRVFASLDGALYTWKQSTGLSLIVDTPYGGQDGKMAVNSATGRVYVGGDWGSDLFTWQESTGLSMVTSGFNAGIGRQAMVVSDDDRVFFGVYTGGGANEGLWTWKPGGSLSSILFSGDTTSALKAGPSGRLYYGDYNGDNYWTWTAAGGVSTLLGGTSDHRMGENNYWEIPNFGNAWVDSSTGRIAFSGFGAQLYTWTPGDPTPATLRASNVLGFGYAFVQGADGRIFMTGASDKIVTWKQSTGLTTLTGALNYGGPMSVDATGRAYFADEHATAGKMFSWTESGGLVTIATGLKNPGSYNYATNTLNGVYFGENKNPGNFYYWNSTIGLKTILSGRNKPGYHNTISNTSTGGVYFGDTGTTASYFYWEPPACVP